MDRLFSFWLVFLVAAAVSGTGAHASSNLSDVKGKLDSVKSEISQTEQQAKTLAAKEKRLSKIIQENRENLIQAARNEQAMMHTLETMEEEIAVLQTEKTAQLAAFREKHGHANKTLSQLIMMSTHSPASLLAMPLHPNEAVRSLVLSRQVVTHYVEESEVIKEDIEALNASERLIQNKYQRIEYKLAELNKNKSWLDYLLAKRGKNYRAVKTRREETLEKVSQLAARAEDFQALLAAIEHERKTRNITPAKRPAYLTHKSGSSIASARGALRQPVSGTILQRFGQKTSVGNTSRGMRITAKAGATVIAPFEGEVVYAGPFRDYGRIVLIEHGDGYHTLLSGLNELNTKVGQWLLSGEPVGTMSRSGEVSLYVEFRRNGTPINMMPWMASTTTSKRLSGGV